MTVVQLPTILLEVVGDSISALNTPGGVANLWTQTAQADLATRFPGSNIVLSNRAVPGTTTAQHWSTQIPLSVGNTPAQHIQKFCLWWAWSPNDGVTASAITTAYNTYQAQFISACRANGFIPVLGTNIPCNGIATVQDDQARLDCNTLVRAAASTVAGSEVIVADFDAVISDHVPRANIIAAYTLDGTHLLTAAGQAAVWPPLSNAIAAYLTSIGVT